MSANLYIGLNEIGRSCVKAIEDMAYTFLGFIRDIKFDPRCKYIHTWHGVRWSTIGYGNPRRTFSDEKITFGMEG